MSGRCLRWTRLLPWLRRSGRVVIIRNTCGSPRPTRRRAPLSCLFLRAASDGGLLRQRRSGIFSALLGGFLALRLDQAQARQVRLRLRRLALCGAGATRGQSRRREEARNTPCSHAPAASASSAAPPRAPSLLPPCAPPRQRVSAAQPWQSARVATHRSRRDSSCGASMSASAVFTAVLRGALGFAVSIKPSTADAAFGLSSSSSPPAARPPPTPPTSSSLLLPSSSLLSSSPSCAEKAK